METLLSKSSTNEGASSYSFKKAKKQKSKKSVLQLSKELIPDEKYLGLSSILEPFELANKK